MSEYINPNDNQEKKKQKPGLSAVRPDDYIEQKFKDMAKESNLSQTEMFEHVFRNYLRAQNDQKKQDALNFEGEISLISKDLNSILLHFKSIAEKAQNTIITITTNADQTEKNLTLETDTLSKRIQELEKRNLELEQANSAFSEIKEGLEKKILELSETISSRDAEIKDLKETVKGKESQIKQLEKESSIAEKELKNLDTAIKNLQDESLSKDSKIKNLEATNSSMSNTLTSIEELKKAEITSIEAKYKVTITELEAKVKSSSEQKERELEAEKKLALAEIKLELADVKSKYAEVLTENNALKKGQPKRKDAGLKK